MPAYSYARMSTDKQSEASITDQLRVCREAAARRSLTLAREFTDEGISGAALGNRPGLLQLLDVLGSGDVLLVVDLTRLSRSQELAPLLDRLRFRGARVLGVLDGFDSDSAHARMQAGLSGLMSDEMRAQIRVRTHSALELRARAGTATGGRCYGYGPDGSVIEGEAAIVREVYERFAHGATLRAIASDLNARDVPAPGAGWDRKARRADARCWSGRDSPSDRQRASWAWMSGRCAAMSRATCPLRARSCSRWSTWPGSRTEPARPRL